MHKKKKLKLLVTGGAGFIGSNLVDELVWLGHRVSIIDNLSTGRKEYINHKATFYKKDIRNYKSIKPLFKNMDCVFHLAAQARIQPSIINPANSFAHNVLGTFNVLLACKENNVKKFISIGTVCSYPKFANIPFNEKDLWNGYPEETNASYGLAKKMLIVQSNAYREQYNFNSITLVQTNLYGPGDNFDPLSSHVIPALIQKIEQAKKSNLDEIEIWGDGTPTRDFLYVDDAARAAILAAENYEKSDPINIGSGKEISIRELTNLIIKLMNTSLKIKWNIQKPNGQPRRCLDIEKARKEIEFTTLVDIEEGLKRTIDWYENEIKLRKTSIL